MTIFISTVQNLDSTSKWNLNVGVGTIVSTALVNSAGAPLGWLVTGATSAGAGNARHDSTVTIDLTKDFKLSYDLTYTFEGRSTLGDQTGYGIIGMTVLNNGGGTIFADGKISDAVSFDTAVALNTSNPKEALVNLANGSFAPSATNVVSASVSYTFEKHNTTLYTFRNTTFVGCSAIGSAGWTPSPGLIALRAGMGGAGWTNTSTTGIFGAHVVKAQITNITLTTTQELTSQILIASATNISGDVLRYTIRRDAALGDESLSIGRATIVLDNFGGSLSPASNTAFTINKSIQITATLGSSLYTLFNGKTEKFTINPALDDRTIIIEASDRMQTLKDVKLDMPVFTDINVGSAYINVLSASGVGSSNLYSVDAMSDTISGIWFSDTNPDKALAELGKTGRTLALVKGDNKIYIKNRYFDFNQTVAGSYINNFLSLDYTLDGDEVINYAKVSGVPRKVTTDIRTVAWITEGYTIQASSAISFTLNYVDPDTQESDTPATNVNCIAYTSNTNSNGTGTNRTAQTSAQITAYALTAVASVFNGSSDVIYLTDFRLHGKSLQKQPEISAISENASSQNTWGKREETIETDFISNPLYAQDYAGYMTLVYKDPQADINIEIKNQYPDVLSIDLGDNIRVQEDNAKINDIYVVKSWEHTANFENGEERTLSLELIRSSKQNWLILDHATKGKLDDVNVLGW